MAFARLSAAVAWPRFIAYALAVAALLALPLDASGQPSPNKPVDRSTGQGAEGPRLVLRPGENYFRADGRPVFVLGRNPVGMHPKAYEEHFRHAAAAGERFMRIHFTYMPPREKPGEIDTDMLASWDAILDAAESHRLAVLPVLGIWAQWNDGSNQEHWHAWDRNPFNVKCGGPAERPSELFTESPCQQLWLKRVNTLVSRWSKRPAIVGWEIFSKLNLVTGATEAPAIALAERAAATIRSADPWKRPITASLAGMRQWPKLLASPAFDFIQIHPYADRPCGGRLDDLILTTVGKVRAACNKPVMIGESGLDSAPPRGTLDVAPRAMVGIRHAIWAAMVSGAMNGRALWWQDGYDQFEKADLCRRYDQVAATAVRFVADVDFTDFAPLACDASAGLKGAMVGNQRIRLGWFRDARCEPPDWPTEPTTGQTVTVAAAGDRWQVEFFDPDSGQSLGKTTIAAERRGLRIALPNFQGSIALKLRQLAP